MTRLLEGVALFDEAKIRRDSHGRFAHKLGSDIVPGGIATGFYFPSDDRRHAGHALTQQIRRSKVSREHDARFASRIAQGVREEWPRESFDLVVSPPPKPGQSDRFGGVRAKVADQLDAKSAAPARQTHAVEGYRQMTVEQRRKAGAQRFEVKAEVVRGKRVVLIDDVVTSGGTAQQLVDALKRAGARSVRFVAVTQATSAPEDRKDPRDRVVEAADSMAKASTHEKVGHTGQGLWKHKGWQLPAYIQHVANDLIDEGKPESMAVHIAVGIVQNWAAGHDGKGHKVSATTQAAAQKAIAEWEALKAKAHASSGAKRLKEAAAYPLPDAERPPRVTLEDLAELAEHAAGRLRLLESAGLPTTAEGAEFDRLLVEAAAYSEALHPRGVGGTWVAKGSSGRATREVQRQVGARQDGSFGDLTAAAVRSYQRKHGLKVDGIVGRQTVAAMRGRKDAAKVKTGKLGTSDWAYLLRRRNDGGSATKGAAKASTKALTPAQRRTAQAKADQASQARREARAAQRALVEASAYSEALHPRGAGGKWTRSAHHLHALADHLDAKFPNRGRGGEPRNAALTMERAAREDTPSAHRDAHRAVRNVRAMRTGLDRAGDTKGVEHLDKALSAAPSPDEHGAPSPSAGASSRAGSTDNAARERIRGTISQLKPGQKYPLVNGQGKATGHVLRTEDGFEVKHPGSSRTRKHATAGGAAYEADAAERQARTNETTRQQARAERSASAEVAGQRDKVEGLRKKLRDYLDQAAPSKGGYDRLLKRYEAELEKLHKAERAQADRAR